MITKIGAQNFVDYSVFSTGKRSFTRVYRKAASHINLSFKSWYLAIRMSIALYTSILSMSPCISKIGKKSSFLPVYTFVGRFVQI